MRSSLLLAALALSVIACSPAEESADAGTGTPDAGASTTPDAGGSRPDAGGQTPDAGPTLAPECTDILQPSDCATCVEQNCCAELAACNDDGDCLTCVGSGGQDQSCADADVAALAEAVASCVQASCEAECTPTSSCNPVTNDGCTANSVCDLESEGTFVCFPPPNDGLICGACDIANGPFCGAGMTCILTSETSSAGTCARFCCTNEDCGTGTCSFERDLPSGVGTCGDSVTAPECTVPATPPSGGACAAL